VAVIDDLFGRNRLLATVDRAHRGPLADAGDHAPLEFQEPIFEQGQPIERVIFPLVGVCSLLSVMEDGRSIEVATIGNEGFVGLPVFLQATLTSSHRAMVQVPGEAITLPAQRFIELTNSGGPLQRTLQRYAQALISQIGQGAACNRLHAVDQRCARWLLMTHDRVDGDEFALTQEFLGHMLGVGRQAVNEAASSLQDQELIRYGRGAITVLDRDGLERASCECYGVIREEFDRLLPPADPA